MGETSMPQVADFGGSKGEARYRRLEEGSSHGGSP